MISLNSVERILKSEGAQLVSRNAKKTMRIVLMDYAKIIAKRSIKLAKHANRKTVRSEDILLAK
jgi:DNA-binding protein